MEIKGYQILEKINKKEDFQIYRAIDLNRNLPVIIKYTPDFKESSRLEKEFEILKLFHSSNIIKPIQSFPFLSGRVLIMEDGGQSLKTYLVEKKYLTIEEFLSIAIETANILVEVHKRKIIHKDIKPANFVLKFENNSKIIKIIDFGISTKLKREEMNWKSIEILEGSLPYISPEQSGRVNRAIDYRTDFYSLGVMYFEILAGRLPFLSRDSMELIHSHIARNPPEIITFRKDIPDNLVLIIRKLLQKDPEKRYRSASGLKSDLERIYSSDFSLGQKDYSDVFSIPQKLYGREQEIEQLLSVFYEVVNTDPLKLVHVEASNSRLLLISGYSGIGKTSFVNETHQSITKENGYFIKGKFDQFQRSTPLSGIFQAFRGLLNQILTDSEDKLNIWKNNLLSVLGENGQILIDVLPELEHILGRQVAPPELGTTENQNRFIHIFLRFLSVFTKKKHPIVLFIDDLQWADLPSLYLIKQMVTDFEINYLLIIGAYRDNEVDIIHPLTQIQEEIKKAGKQVDKIHLNPIGLPHIKQLLSDTLYTNKDVDQLAVQMHKKTGGNPFFLTEFLKTLHRDEIIQFNYEGNIWEWDVQKIQSVGITDNVIDLMIKNIKNLSKKSIKILSLASCLGNRFEMKVLSFIANLPSQEILKIMNIISEEGLLVKEESNYFRFQHDRVQEAAYTFISDNNKKKIHLMIGRLLLENTDPLKMEEYLFEIVSHYNKGISRIKDDSEKLKIIKLNLEAGKKAKKTAAYAQALIFVKNAVNLLPKNSWENYYHLSLEIYYEIAELEFLNTNFSQAEYYYKLVLEYAKTLPEKMRIWEIQFSHYSIQNRFQETLELSYTALEELGQPLPRKDLDPVPDLIKSKQLLEGRKISELINFVMEDEEKLLIVRMLSMTLAPAYISNPNLLPIILLRLVNMSLEFGVNRFCSFAFSTYGSLILGGQFGDYEGALEFGKLAVEIVEKLNALSMKSKAYFSFASFVNHFRNHSKYNEPYYKTCIQSGLESGDTEFTIYGINNFLKQQIFIRYPLEKIEESFENYYTIVKKLNLHAPMTYFLMWWQLTLNLQGKSESMLVLKGDRFDQDLVEVEALKQSSHSILSSLYLSKTILHFLFGSKEDSFKYSSLAIQYEGGNAGMMSIPENRFFRGLSIIAMLKMGNISEKDTEISEELEKIREQMKIWAENCEANYAHKYFILEAEISRLRDNGLEAIKYFSKAIDLAKQNEFFLEEAIANELACSLWKDLGNEQYASLHLQQAHLNYQKWGCLPKCKQLEENYINFNFQNNSNTPITITDTYISNLTTTESIDVQTLIKNSIAISEEIKMDKLLEKVMKIMIENAGAERGVLLSVKDGKYFIETFFNEGINVLKEKGLPLEEDTPIPRKIINYVERTNNSIVIDDALTDSRFNSDPYILENGIRSVLSSPILLKGQLNGIIYLENNLTANVFTEKRVRIVNMLSSQAAISIENAKLYQLSNERENQFRTLIENVNIGIYRITGGEKAIFLQANPAIAKIFGFETVEEFKQVSIEDLYDNENELAKFNQIMQREGYCKNLELKLKKNNGVFFYANCSASYTYDEEGNVLWIDGIIEDISDLKATTDELILLSETLEMKVFERTNELSKAKTEIETLNEFLKLINSTSDLVKIFKEVYKYLNEFYGFELLWTLFFESNGEIYSDYSTTHFTESHEVLIDKEYFYKFRQKLDESLGSLFFTYKTKVPFYIKLIDQEYNKADQSIINEYSKYIYSISEIDQSILKYGKFKTLLQMPMLLHGEVIGIINLSASSKVLDLKNEDIEKITGFSNQIAGVVYNAQLLKQTENAKRQAEIEKGIALLAQKESEKAHEEIQFFNDFSKIINSEINLDKIFLHAVEVLTSKIDSDTYWLQLLNSENVFYTRCLHTSSEVINELKEKYQNLKIELSPSVGSIYLTYKRRKILYSPNVNRFKKKLTYYDNMFLTDLHSNTSLQVPLLLKNEVIGILNINKYGGMKEINKQDLNFIETLSEQLAIAVNNSNLYELTETERIKSEKLLLNILPNEIVRELKEKGVAEPRLFESVSVMFTDFKGFTQIAEKMSAEELVKELDSCFVQFDKITERYNLEKLKTIGDSYMCAGGIPKINATHAVDCILAALEIQAFMRTMKELKEKLGIPYWELRLGIHSGPLIAGVIGEKKFAYDVWGDTVNTASRMESSGSPGMINISGSTYKLVKDYFDCQYRGLVNAKNKGEVEMYFVQRIKPEFSRDSDGLVPNQKFFNLFQYGFKNIL